MHLKQLYISISEVRLGTYLATFGVQRPMPNRPSNEPRPFSTYLGYGVWNANAEPLKSVSPHASGGRLVDQTLVVKLAFIGTVFRTTFLE